MKSEDKKTATPQPEQPQPAAEKTPLQPENKPARKGADKIRRHTIKTI